MKKVLYYKMISDDTAILYYVGTKRSAELESASRYIYNPFPQKLLDGNILNLVIDKSCNSFIGRNLNNWNKFNIIGHIKIYDLDLKSKKEEYECDGIIHTFSNSWIVRGITRSNKYRPSFKINKKDNKTDTGLSEPNELTEFYIDTICQFKACKMPKRIPDYISYTRDGKISSMYWYGSDSKGSYVIRYSNHWSRISKNIKSGNDELFQCQTVGTCWWTLIGCSATKCGKAYSNDFKNRRP